MPQHSPPTIRDVARMARVHHATVSRALRHDPRISAATRRRVEAAAAQLKYLKSPLVSAHMAQIRRNRPASQQGVIAFLLPYADRKLWPTGYRRLYVGAEERASALGYRLEAFGFADAAVAGRSLNRIFRARAIYGVLLCPLYEGDPPLELDWSRYALAQMSSHSVAAELHLATTHPYETVRTCLREMAALGYRRIGLHVERKVDIKLNGEWSAAYALSQLATPAPRRVPPLLQECLNEAEFAAWIRRHKPDALLTKHIRAVQWLEKIGLRIPDDIGFAHLDWRPELGDCAGLFQHVHVVSAMAVDLVVEQLYHNERGIPPHAKTLLVKGEWRSGPTLRRA